MGWGKEPSCKVEGLLQSPLLQSAWVRPWSGQGIENQTADPSRAGLGEEALRVCTSCAAFLSFGTSSTPVWELKLIGTGHSDNLPSSKTVVLGFHPTSESP